MEHTNLRWKVEAGKLHGQMTENTLERLSKSMNLGEIVDRKMCLGPVQEEGAEEGTKKERVNRKTVFSDQIKKGVDMMELS